MVPYQNSTTWCLNVVMSVKIYVSHNAVYIPEFCSCIMNSNIRSDLNVWKSRCMLVVVYFGGE